MTVRNRVNALVVLLASVAFVAHAADPVVSNVRASQLAGTKLVDVSPVGMVLIPGGTNTGTNPLAPGESYASNYPLNYSLTEASFCMDRCEVTKALWDEVKNWNGGNGYAYDNAGSGKATNHPVQTVNWYDCVKWCNARSQKEGRTPVYYTDAAYTQIYKIGRVYGVAPYVKNTANGYRLPTDVQWEYAARGGAVSHRFPWSDTDTIQHARANYYSSSGYSYTSPTRGYHQSYTNAPVPYTSPVGSFAANGYGVCDMAGNVWEWCYDWYPGLKGDDRVIRGGSWGNTAYGCRVGLRGFDKPAYAYYDLGFRAVLPADNRPTSQAEARKVLVLEAVRRP